MLAVQRRARTEQRAQGHHRALAQMVDRRVRHLCEALAQERRHRPRTSRERRQRRVVTHGRHGLVTGRRRRAEEEEEILAREPDPHLARCQILRRRFDRHACVEGTHACAQPARVRPFAREPSLDCPALLDAERRVDDEHVAGAEPPAPDADALGER